MRKKKPIVPIQQRSAQTAGFNCVCRAQSFYEKDPLLKGSDHIAPKMVPFAIKLMLRLKIVKLLSSIVPRSTYTYTIARTKFFDHIFKKAVKNNFEQIVTFCPGYDSRGIRFLTNETETKLFELDVKETQRLKFKGLKKQKIYFPSNIAFIAVNFDLESIKERLLSSDFKGNRKTLFILEGAFMVLNKRSLAEIFELFQSITGKQSEIVFDCIDKSLFEDNSKLNIISMTDSDAIRKEYFSKTDKTAKQIKNKHYIVHAGKQTSTPQTD